MPSCIFCAGAEGSGTTLLLHLLAAPARCVTAWGAMHIKLPPGAGAIRLATAFRQSNQAVWDLSDPARGNDRGGGT
jgi:hypothetical protein